MGRSSAGRPIISKKIPAVMKKLMKTAMVAIQPAVEPFIFEPKKRLITKAASGTSTIKGMRSVTALPLQNVDLGNIDGLSIPEESNDDRKSDGCFGSGDRHHEEDQYLSGLIS